MKKLIVVAALTLFSSLAFAQNTPSWELFGGYSYARINPTGAPEGVNTSGWEAAANYNFNKTWGLKADFSGHYCCEGESLHTFMGGPQISWRSDKWTLFAHGLVGGAHADSVTEDTSFAWVAGGGFDWKFGERWGWRVAQVDYLGTHFLDDTQHNLRVSTGVVFRFGKK